MGNGWGLGKCTATKKLEQEEKRNERNASRNGKWGVEAETLH